MSRGGDSQEALRAIWMEGYNRARRDLGLAPYVTISTEDLRAVFSVRCASRDCPTCKAAEAAEAADSEIGTK